MKKCPKAKSDNYPERQPIPRFMKKRLCIPLLYSLIACVHSLSGETEASDPFLRQMDEEKLAYQVYTSLGGK